MTNHANLLESRYNYIYHALNNEHGKSRANASIIDEVINIGIKYVSLDVTNDE